MENQIIYKTIDLCAGIGGIRRGFEMTGRFENVLSAEIDATARETYKWLYNEDPEHDLTTNDFKNKTATSGCDVLLAGFPCQTFSSAGLQKGFQDETKGTIFFHILEIMQRCMPKAVFLENVENLLCHDKGNTLRTIINSLEFNRNYKVIGVSVEKTEAGEKVCKYSRRSFLRNSKFFGVPQNRPRVYIMAFSRRHFGKAIDAISNWELPQSGSEEIFADVTSILEPVVGDKYYMASGYLKTLKKHKKAQRKKKYGFGYVVVNEPRKDGGKMVSNTILATGGSGKECNMIRQYKAGIAGKIVPGKKTPLNSESLRVMTPTEWGRLQGFIGFAFKDKQTGKDGFSFPPGVSDAQKYKQFGNSVTVPVINEMAKFMLKCFDAMDPEYQKKRVEDLLRKTGRVTRNMVAELLGLNPLKCGQILHEMVVERRAYLQGTRRAAFYTPFSGVGGMHGIQKCHKL